MRVETHSGSSSSLTRRVLHTFEDVVWHVSWSVSGNILAVSGGDNKVVWRLAISLFLTTQLPPGFPVEGDPGRAVAVYQ